MGQQQLQQQHNKGHSETEGVRREKGGGNISSEIDVCLRDTFVAWFCSEAGAQVSIDMARFVEEASAYFTEGSAILSQILFSYHKQARTEEWKFQPGLKAKNKRKTRGKERQAAGECQEGSPEPEGEREGAGDLKPKRKKAKNVSGGGSQSPSDSMAKQEECSSEACEGSQPAEDSRLPSPCEENAAHALPCGRRHRRISARWHGLPWRTSARGRPWNLHRY